MAKITLREIYGQPEGWQEAIDNVQAVAGQLRELAQGKPVTFCGCGTSFYIAVAAARVYQEVAGVPARAVSAGELFITPQSFFAPGHQGPLFAISRSGETSETVRAARFYKEQGYGPVVGLTGKVDSNLAAISDLPLFLKNADDQSVVMTRSYTTMLLASWVAAAVTAGAEGYLAELSRLPGLAEDAIRRAAPLAEELGQLAELDQFVYLGLGTNLGSAQEGMLKLKEMTQVACEAYSPLEFRHGPISILRPDSCVILLTDQRGSGYYEALVKDIKRLGARVVALGLPVAGADWHLELGTDLSDLSRSLLYMPFLQLLGVNRALLLGRDPDQPVNLNRVVVLEA